MNSPVADVEDSGDSRTVSQSELKVDIKHMEGEERTPVEPPPPDGDSCTLPAPGADNSTQASTGTDNGSRSYGMG